MPGDIDAMTHDQQIGQLFMVGFSGLEPTPEIIELIQQWRVGGVILFTRNCHDARQVSRLTHDLQALAHEAGHPAPLLIATDQENGLVRRLGESITNFPGAMALGAVDDDGLTQAVAEATGRELRALGINMNLAPDADVNNNPANPVIGVRSFGEDPQLVARLSAAAVRGYRAAGVVCAPKHFPGHGDTAVDSHLGLPTIPHMLERMLRVELVPFRADIVAGAQSVMLAHLRLPQLAPDDAAASVSPAIVRLLRDTLGFEGVIMTDCLEMDAIAATLGVERGAELALRAGVDLVLISHHIAPQRGAIERARAAIASGALAADVIDRAAARVLRLKASLGSWDALPALVEVATVSDAAHRRLSDDAYARSTTLVRDDAHRLPLLLPSEARILVVAQPPASVTKAVDTVYQHADLVDAIRARHANTRGVCLAPDASDDASDEAIAELLRAAETADLLIVTTINAHLDPPQQRLMERLLACDRPIIGIAACNPYDLAAFPAAPTALATYEYTQPALNAAVSALFGDFIPAGRLPVSLPTLGEGASGE